MVALPRVNEVETARWTLKDGRVLVRFRCESLLVGTTGRVTSIEHWIDDVMIPNEQAVALRDEVLAR